MEIAEALVSPTFLAFATALAALIAVRGKLNRRLAAVLWAGVVWSYLCSAPLTVNAVVDVLERQGGEPCERVAAGTTLVVLMGGVQLDAASSSDFAKLHEASIQRLLEASRLAAVSPGGTVIVAGGLGTGTTTEAKIGAEFLSRLGVARERILIEDVGRSTREAAVEVARILAGRGSQPVVTLVTSAIHMPRAALLFEQRGIRIMRCPADYIHIPSRSMRALLPQTGAVQRARRVIHEVAGLVAARAFQ